MRVADCERDVRAGNEPATLGGNESQERVCICFTNGPEHGEGKTRGNKCQRDFMARSNDFSLPRTTPWNNELSFASPFGKQRRAHRLLPHRQFLFDSSFFREGKKKNTRQVRISMIYFLLIPFTSDKNILSMFFYFLFIYYRIPIYHSLNILYFIYVYRSILRRKYLFYILIFCESFRDKK